MTETKLRYIGKKAVKKDNVAQSGFVWDHPGQVREVPIEVAVRLLNYPSIWVEEGAANDPGNNASYEYYTGANERHVINGKGEAVESEIKVVDPDAVKAVENATPFTYSNDPDEAVEQAIRQLDPENDDHFTGGGLPRVEAIETLLTYPVKAEKRNEVWERLQADNPTTLDEEVGKPTEPQLVQ